MEPIAGLSNDYQILTELYHSGESRTYLARHLQLNRDVTLTTVRAAGDRSFLTAFANDAELLKTQRHPNLMPVIEGRWLDDDTFAVARARVRGSSLEHLIDAVGTMPPQRIDAALREITGALVFAREAGVTNRFISPQSLVFQQGTGRALISFEASRLIADDAQTLRELARRMNGGADYDVSEFVRMLGVPATAASFAPPVTAPVAERAVPVPVERDDAVVVVERGGMGFGARVFTTFLVLAVLVAAAWMFWPRRPPEAPRTASNVATRDTDSDAAGDVALRSRVDTTVYPTPRIVEREPPIPSQVPAPTGAQPQPPLTTTPQPTQQPLTTTPPMQRQVPPTRTEPIVPPARLPEPPIDTVARPPSSDVCDSPSDSDQRQCLSTAIERNDRELNSVYQRLIAALRRQAAVPDDAPDPPAVESLRASQRRWLEERDQACRSVGSGALYARARSACFADRSATRMAELQQQLPPS